MLAKASENCPDATLLRDDMQSFTTEKLGEVASSGVSAIISSFALHHMPTEDAAKGCISHWAGMLITGGALMVGAWEGEGPMPNWDEDEGEGEHASGGDGDSERPGDTTGASKAGEPSADMMKEAASSAKTTASDKTTSSSSGPDASFEGS